MQLARNSAVVKCLTSHACTHIRTYVRTLPTSSSLQPNVHTNIVCPLPPPLAAQCLHLSEVFAATPVYSKPTESSNSHAPEDGVAVKHSTLFRHKSKRNPHKLSTAPQPKVKGFALRSLHPSKPGHVVCVQFMCSSPEMSTTWLDSIRTQMQGERRVFS